MAARVSVLLPSYNHSAYIAGCLDSIFGQSYEDWELIAIDDQSSDDSFQKLQDRQDRRTTALQNESNLGTYGTLSRALSLANGEFVAVINSDDLWKPEKLALQVALMDETPGIPWCFSKGYLMDESGTERGQVGSWDGITDDTVQEALPSLLQENNVLASSVLFRRSKANFLPELRYSGDWVSLLVPAREAPVGYNCDPLSYWRIHPQSSHVRSESQVQEEVLVRESMLVRPTYWEVSRLPRSWVRRGLAACARHLSALYVLQGRMTEARHIARAAVRFQPSKSGLRRLAVVTLSQERARKRLWGDVPRVPRGAERELIKFAPLT